MPTIASKRLFSLGMDGERGVRGEEGDDWEAATRQLLIQHAMWLEGDQDHWPMPTSEMDTIKKIRPRYEDGKNIDWRVLMGTMTMPPNSKGHTAG